MESVCSQIATELEQNGTERNETEQNRQYYVQRIKKTDRIYVQRTINEQTVYCLEIHDRIDKIIMYGELQQYRNTDVLINVQRTILIEQTVCTENYFNRTESMYIDL